MKLITNLFFLFIISISYCQNETKYESVLSEIYNSHEVLCTGLIIPNEDYSVGIYTEEWIVEDLTPEQCGDIKTNPLQNKKLIGILKERGLLNKIYSDTENNEYLSLNSEDKFEWNKAVLIVSLSFSNDWNNLNQVYLPINDKKEAKKIIKEIEGIFKVEYCFKKLIKEL